MTTRWAAVAGRLRRVSDCAAYDGTEQSLTRLLEVCELPDTDRVRIEVRRIGLTDARTPLSVGTMALRLDAGEIVIFEGDPCITGVVFEYALNVAGQRTVMDSFDQAQATARERAEGRVVSRLVGLREDGSRVAGVWVRCTSAKSSSNPSTSDIFGLTVGGEYPSLMGMLAARLERTRSALTAQEGSMK